VRRHRPGKDWLQRRPVQVHEGASNARDVLGFPASAVRDVDGHEYPASGEVRFHQERRVRGQRAVRDVGESLVFACGVVVKYLKREGCCWVGVQPG
jgi:hypothetical protein